MARALGIELSFQGLGWPLMTRIAIIAAMEREVRPLIRNWKSRTIRRGEREYRLFENGDAGLVCGGIGAEAARRATEAVIQELHPARVISVGFAGALDGSLPIGHVLEPRTVINAADGSRTEVGSGDGVLVSSATVVGKEQKIRLGKSYGASAVDMEAAAVAEGARARGVEFGALKAISDAADFSLPAIDQFVANDFVTHDGSFQSFKFACHVALRPWLWRTTIALARNSSKASHSLSDALKSYLCRETLARQSSAESLDIDMNQKGGGPMFASAHTSNVAGSHTVQKENNKV
jgi:adenosylhomocysteine nucleosidase